MFALRGWKRFAAAKRPKVIKRWLKGVGAESYDVFKAGMLGRHTGRIYSRPGGRRHQASAPGEYAANDTGDLLRSAKSTQTRDSATFGTNKAYSKYLREGTGRMKRRKMSDNALKEGGLRARSLSSGWAGFNRRKQND